MIGRKKQENKTIIFTLFLGKKKGPDGPLGTASDVGN
jgi:hypothetical protein